MTGYSSYFHIRMRRKGQSEKPQHCIQEADHILLLTAPELAAGWLSGKGQLLPGHLSSIPRACTHTVEGQNHLLSSPDLHTTGEHTKSRSNYIYLTHLS